MKNVYLFCQAFLFTYGANQSKHETPGYEKAQYYIVAVDDKTATIINN